MIDIIRVLNMSEEAISNLSSDDKLIDVQFSDGLVQMTPTELLIDKIILKNTLVYDGAIIKDVLKQYSITRNYVNGMFSPSTLNETLSNIRIDVATYLLDTLPSNTLELINHLDSGIISAINEIYIKVSISAYDSMITLDIKDLVEMYNDKDIRAAVDNVKKVFDADSIVETYSTIDRVIKEKYDRNNLGMSYLGKVAKDKQVQHILGVRGFVQDLDGKIYKYPIPYGYLEGLKDIVSYLIESKTAAIALFHSNSSITDSEWFAREAQIKAQSVRFLKYEDCGTTTNLLDIVVTQEGLKDFKGCYAKEHLDDKEYKLIMDDSVVGKRMHIRHTGSCNLPNHDEVCVKCFGLMGIGIPPTTNIGAYCSVSTTEEKSQNMLSFKHLMNSATASKPILNNVANKFLHYINKDNCIKVRAQAIKIKGGDILHIELPLHQVTVLEGNVSLKSIETTYIKQMSEFKEMVFVYIGKDGEINYIEGVSLLKQKTPLSFSMDFIQHVLATKCYTVGTDNNIRISLEGWASTSGLPIMIPSATAEAVTLGLENFKDLLTKCKFGKEKPVPIEINSAINRVYSNIGHGDHLSLLSTLLYSTTQDSNNPFKLARADEIRVCNKFRDVFEYMSFSAIIGYGYLTTYTNTSVLLSKERQDHPLDVLLTPQILNSDL